MTSRIGWAVVVAACAAAAGCAGNAGGLRSRAGTGDVAFRLVWEGLSDLDLMVEDPSGACIAYGTRKSPSGGILDIDCNGSTESTCDHPIENTFWPPATAPAGNYRFWVHAHTVIPATDPLPFELQLLRGKQVAWALQGVIKDVGGFQGPFVYSYPAGAMAPPAGPAVEPCGIFRYAPPEEEGD
jgi:hypothetical protein